MVPKTGSAGSGNRVATTPEGRSWRRILQGQRKAGGKKAVITGGDSGIGRAVAIAFAREGADVLISYLDDTEDEDANTTAGLVEAAGRKVVLVKGDIQDEVHCQHIIDTAVKEFGGLDILVNNAAFQMARKTMADIPSEEWDRTFRTNITAMFFLCKAAEPHLKPGSSIINTTSVNAYSPSVHSSQASWY